MSATVGLYCERLKRAWVNSLITKTELIDGFSASLDAHILDDREDLTVEEAAAKIGVTPRRVYELKDRRRNGQPTESLAHFGPRLLNVVQVLTDGEPKRAKTAVAITHEFNEMHNETVDAALIQRTLKALRKVCPDALYMIDQRPKPSLFFAPPNVVLELELVENTIAKADVVLDVVEGLLAQSETEGSRLWKYDAQIPVECIAEFESRVDEVIKDLEQKEKANPPTRRMARPVEVVVAVKVLIDSSDSGTVAETPQNLREKTSRKVPKKTSRKSSKKKGG